MVNLHRLISVSVTGAAEKLRKFLRDFELVDVKTAAGMVDWKKAPVVELKRAEIFQRIVWWIGDLYAYLRQNTIIW